MENPIYENLTFRFLNEKIYAYGSMINSDTNKKMNNITDKP